MSNNKPSYIFKSETYTLVDGVKSNFEQVVRDGPRGLDFKLFDKKGDEVLKYAARKNDSGNYFLYSKIDGESKKEEMSEKDLFDFIKKTKVLAFVANYLKKRKKD